MVAIRVSPFGGMVPAVDDRLLPDINAVLSENTWLYAGTAVGLPEPKVIYTLINADAGKVYRLPNNYTDSSHLEDSIWMEFASADTDVLRTLVIDDIYDRFYWVSPLDVPRYYPRASIAASVPAVASAYMLGIPAPNAPTGGASGGASATLKSVAYVNTWVSAYGEEGPPSPPLSLTGVKIDATVNLTLTTPDPNDIAGPNRNLTLTRIYRTITGTDGTTTFFFVAEQDINDVTYSDNAGTATDAVISLNAELESTTWTGPPDDLQGMVSLSNGIVVAFRENELWFCEPFRLHAWPAQYVLVTEYPIVGLGVSNQTLVVATEGFAYTVTGINPASMSLTKLPGLLPCTSRGSIVSTTDGVYFSTPGGLVIVSPSGLAIATKELIRKDKWNALVATSTLRAAQLGPGYFAFGQARFGVFDEGAFDNDAFAQEDFSGARSGIIIDPTSQSVAFNLLTSVDPITNIQTDAWSAELFIIRNGEVQWMDIGDNTQTKNLYTWRSKVFQAGMKKNFQAMKTYFNETPTWPISYVQDELLPAMTGQVTSGVTVIADTFSAVGLEAWRASSEVVGDSWLSGSGALPHWLTVELAAAKTVTTYTIQGPPPTAAIGTAPKSWTLAGSNDGVNFTTVDTRTLQAAFVADELRDYTVDTPGEYKYYKLNVTAVQSGTVVSLAGFQLFQSVFGRVRVYADGNQVFQRNLVMSGEQWRLPSGFKADFWQVEIESGVEIFSMQLATSATELQSV